MILDLIDPNAVLAVIGLSAVASPFLTAVLNNHHLQKMKKMEYEHEIEMHRMKHQEELIDSFARNAGQCIKNDMGVAHEDAQRFQSSASVLAAYIEDEAIRNEIFAISADFKSAQSFDARQQIAKRLDKLLCQIRLCMPK